VVAHLEATVGGTVDYQIATMDIADYLQQGGQTAGHRELWLNRSYYMRKHRGTAVPASARATKARASRCGVVGTRIASAVMPEVDRACFL
jgi:hypothetical protein